MESKSIAKRLCNFAFRGIQLTVYEKAEIAMRMGDDRDYMSKMISIALHALMKRLFAMEMTGLGSRQIIAIMNSVQNKIHAINMNKYGSLRNEEVEQNFLFKDHKTHIYSALNELQLKLEKDDIDPAEKVLASRMKADLQETAFLEEYDRLVFQMENVKREIEVEGKDATTDHYDQLTRIQLDMHNLVGKRYDDLLVDQKTSTDERNALRESPKENNDNITLAKIKELGQHIGYVAKQIRYIEELLPDDTESPQPPIKKMRIGL